MKLVELECENCGAALKIEEGSNIVNCPYCKATYKIDDEAKHIKYDNMENSGYEFEKGRIKAQREHAKNIDTDLNTKSSKFMIIPFCMVAITMIVMIVFSTFSWNNKYNRNNSGSSNSSNSSNSDSKETQEEAKRKLESEVHSFNWHYSNGKMSGFFVKNDLNDVINSNRTNKERLITVKFNGIETQDSEKILEIIEQIDTSAEYNVLLDYDTDGFITTITIK